jgi:hypothetical protein
MRVLYDYFASVMLECRGAVAGPTGGDMVPVHVYTVELADSANPTLC